jgi:hypothetical protein
MALSHFHFASHKEITMARHKAGRKSRKHSRKGGKLKIHGGFKAVEHKKERRKK